MCVCLCVCGGVGVSVSTCVGRGRVRAVVVGTLRKFLSFAYPYVAYSAAEELGLD